MAQFSYSDYTNVVNRAQTGGSTSVKVGFFKLPKDGQQALVRINLESSADELHFATIHKPVYGKRYEGLSNPFAGISCMNPLGSYSDDCPLCKAALQEDAVVGKATKQVYVQMMVAYKDASTNRFGDPQPVVWERPAGFAKELASKLQTFGSLKKVLFLITRTGSGKDTRYILDYAPEQVFKPELVPEDFSAFDNFDVKRHSYWEKTVEEIENFLATGTFETAEAAKEVAPAAPAAQPAMAAAPQATFAQPAQPAQPQFGQTAFATQPAAQPAAQPATQTVAEPKVNTPKSSGTIGGWTF